MSTRIGAAGAEMEGVAEDGGGEGGRVTSARGSRARRG